MTELSPENVDPIKTHLHSALSPSKPSPTLIQKWTSLILAAYTAPQRHYHTTIHITSMLHLLSIHQSEIQNPAAVTLAILFHDYIYDPISPPGYNEEESIRQFEVFASEVNLPPALVDKVSTYIEATIPPPDKAAWEDEDLKYFLDLDLEVLGRERKEYDIYRR